MDQLFSRRIFVQLGATAGGAFALAPRLLRADGPQTPHFFLQIFVQGGLDQAYLFDARPPSFRAAGKAHSYLTTDPTVFNGSNGVSTLCASVAQPLMAFSDRFSIINGVHMSASFDGHDQNTNVLLTGNPFGGACQFPFLNGTGGADVKPVDYLQLGRIPNLVIANASAGVTIDPRPAANFSATLQQNSANPPDEGVLNMARQRLSQSSAGTGMFSDGARHLFASMQGSRSLADKIRSVNVAAALPGTDAQLSAALVMEYFRLGITNSALVTMLGMPKFDVHAAGDAQAQPSNVAATVTDLVAILTALRDTPFDDTRKFIDVTTVLISSEFSRTNYQVGKAMDATGTDHNPFGNSVFIGGKGIKPGMVIGATDLDALDPTGNLTSVSKSHKTMDGNLVKKMGKPFDFATLLPTAALPEVYDLNQYLNYASVANTVYRLFGVDSAHWWQIVRNGPVAPALGGLLNV